MRLFVSAMMGESGTRKGERAKKVPKYMQYDDADYGYFPAPKTAEQKERQATSAEIAQIARLLQKFLAALSQKLRDHGQNHQHLTACDPRQPLHPSNPSAAIPAPQHGHLPKNSITAQGTAKHRKDAGEMKTGKGESRKTASGVSLKATLSSSLQVDQDYNGMLNEHMRSAFPNAGSLSAEAVAGKAKAREEKKGKGGRREELKPFKRQSYHVAIAYHIHLKRLRSANPSAADIDPTLPARKLRESQQPPGG